MLSFGWVVLVCTIASIIAIRIRIPHVPILLILGALIGPHILGLVDLEVMDLFSEIGAVLLLFGIGVQFNVAKLLSKGLRAIIGSLMLMILTFTFMYEVAFFIGFDGISAVFMAVLFSMSSTAIMIKILEYEGFLKKMEVEVLVAMLVVEDLIAIFLLTFFSNLSNGNLAENEIVLSFLLACVVLVFSYLVLGKIVRKLATVLITGRSTDMMMFISFLLGIGMSIFASFIGLTPAIGAFLAGSIIASLPNGRIFERTMRPFSILFSAFFFLSIGMLIEPVELATSTLDILIIVSLFILAIFAFTICIFFLLSTNLKSSIFAGAAMLPLGEFSLLIAKAGSGLVQFNAINLAASGVVISSIACAIALQYNLWIYKTVKKTIPKNILKAMVGTSLYFREIIGIFEPGGPLSTLLKREIMILLEHVIRVVSIIILFFFGKQYVHFQFEIFGLSLWTDSILLGLAIASVIPSLFRVLIFIKRALDILSYGFSRTSIGDGNGVIARNVAISGILFGFYATTPYFVNTLMLPKIFSLGSIGFAILSLLFMWAAISLVSVSLFSGETTQTRLMRKKSRRR